MDSLCIVKNHFVFAVSIILFVIGALTLLLELQYFLFGRGPTNIGGKVGKWIDNGVQYSMFSRESIRHSDDFEQCMGYTLSHLAEKGANQVGVHVLLNSWLAHSLSRMKFRQVRVDNFFLQSQYVKSPPDYCTTPILFLPYSGEWFRPFDAGISTQRLVKDVDVLFFDEEQVSLFLLQNFELLYHTIFQKARHFERIELFGFAVVSAFGGIFASPNVRNSPWTHITSPDFRLRIKCSDKPMMFFQTTASLDRVFLLASSPHHPKLQCALEAIVDSSSFTGLRSLILLIRGTNWNTSCSSGCCLINEMPALPVNEDTFSILDSDSSERDGSENDIIKNRYVVTISERIGSEPNTNIPRRRHRISDQLQMQHCSAGWFCNRCLRMPFAGTLRACQKVCRSCYIKTICTAPRQNATAYIDVKVVERRVAKEKRIPRIVHQTWFENVTLDRYPHLHRLQNSWKASGWDYRFYTDNDCALFIKKNYPLRFVEAYEAILPGAFKADFFRLLVLLKDGGIYADIDVQLEADLDNFVTDELSFFVPRDVPLDYWPNSNYCLWNGLMGSSPGHPIIAKAVEDILSTIQNRYDYNDIERNICSHNMNANIWKLRSLPILILTGPCALGMSVNSAIGHHDLVSGHVLGWLKTENVSADHQPSNYYWGDAFTLLADRYDLGELRFTDVDRNLIIASSDQDRITKTPISDGKPRVVSPSTHYSKSATDIVGEHGVYRDDISTEENVKLVVFLEVH